MIFPEKYIKRFWSRVSIAGANECWKYVGAKGKNKYNRITRYGKMHIQGKSYATHQFSYILKYGYYEKGLSICHTCDNGWCVNPDHLFTGTHTDNMRDMVKKGRLVVFKGEEHHNAKLTIHKVKEIRTIISNSLIYNGKVRRGVLKDLARKFNVGYSTIVDIRRNHRWKEVTI